MQEYQTLSVLLSQLFGGKNNNKGSAPASVEEAHAQLSALFGKK